MEGDINFYSNDQPNFPDENDPVVAVVRCKPSPRPSSSTSRTNSRPLSSASSCKKIVVADSEHAAIQSPQKAPASSIRDRIYEVSIAMGFTPERADWASRRTTSVEAAVNLLTDVTIQSPQKAPAISIRDRIYEVSITMGFTPERADWASRRATSVEAAVNLLTGVTLPEPELKCAVCQFDIPVSEMITMTCAHRLCVDCFQGYCSSKINDNNVGDDELACPAILNNGSGPHKICGTPITYEEVKAHVPAAVQLKFERFRFRRFCEENKLSGCPKCDEWYVDVSNAPEGTWESIECPREECKHKFCGKCRQRPHKKQPEQDISCEAFAEWLKVNEKVDETFEKYLKENKIFPCPSCKRPGQLNEGCKFLYCLCKCNFCALCGKQLTQNEHFSHFNNAPYGNNCKGVSKCDDCGFSIASYRCISQ